VGRIWESALAVVGLEVRVGFWLEGGVDRRRRLWLVGCGGGLMYKYIFD
jgi:hypothetical protein